MKRVSTFRLPITIATLSAALLLAAPGAFAQVAAHQAQHHPGGQPAMMEGGMAGGGMMGGGMMGGGMGGKDGEKGHQLAPHNAASHFLQMADMLDLTDAQIASLRKLRDAYITALATDTERLIAAKADLQRGLRADDIDSAEVERLLKEIDTLEDQLWPAFVNQLRDIKGLLTPEQKQRLRAKHMRH